MTTWYLNGLDIATLGLTIVAGSKRSHDVSSMQLATGADFDAAPILDYGDAVTISYSIDGGAAVPYFVGKNITLNRYGAANAESQTYEIVDAWHDIATTIYQESWGYGETTTVGEDDKVHLRADRIVPRAIFGMNAAGELITVGQQIANAIGYAASVGISIQAGSIPTGEYPTQSELQNVTIAEVIAMAMKYHPDWMPWIDYATSPPTFHVTPVASAASISLPIDGTGLAQEIDVTERLDLIPQSVRIVYEFAGEANVEGDPEIFRKSIIDKYPTDGPDAGPGVLCAVIPLQGLQMQSQKSRLHTRTIPTNAADAKAFIRDNYLHFRDVPPEEITVTGWDREMIPEAEDFPEPINPEAERVGWENDPDKYPRQLLRGSVEDWMRVRVAEMVITPTVIAAGGASPATIAAVAKGTPPIGITATNGRNKTYHGPTQWVPPEEVPSGVAQGVYQAILAGVRFQGSIPVVSEGMPVGQYLGKKLNLTGSDETALASMNAPIHAVDWDIETGTAVISFGPVPYLAPQDFLELQRLFRSLPVVWWSTDERTDDKIGAQDKPSAHGDTVGAFDLPQTRFEPGGGADATGAFYRIFVGDDGHTYLQGGTCTAGTGTETAANIKIIDSGTGPTQSPGVHMYIIATGNGVADDAVLQPGFNLTSATIGYNATVPPNTLPTYSSPNGKVCHVELGVFTDEGFLPSAIGNVEIAFCLGGYHVDRSA